MFADWITRSATSVLINLYGGRLSSGDQVHPGRQQGNVALAHQVVVLTRFHDEDVAGLERGGHTVDLDDPAALQDAERLGHRVDVVPLGVAALARLVPGDPAPLDVVAGDGVGQHRAVGAAGEVGDGQLLHACSLV